MDPIAVAAVMVALIAIGVAGRLRCRAARAEALVVELQQEVAALQQEVQAEHHAACHDPLTGLPNRRAFYRLGARMVADPGRHPLLAVVIDLDNFKQVNDCYGHAAGDQVLVTVAQRIAEYAGDNLVARLGGDEFAALLTSPTVESGWLDQLRRGLADALAAPMSVGGQHFSVTASVGLVQVARDDRLADALRSADVAMYQAKTGYPAQSEYQARAELPAQSEYPARAEFPAQSEYPARAEFPAQSEYPAHTEFPARADRQQPSHRMTWRSPRQFPSRHLAETTPGTEMAGP